MKPSATDSRPRLICRVVRHFHADRPTQGSWAHRHLEGCAGCADFYQNLTVVDQSLATGSPDLPESIPAGLEDRIWAAVESDRAVQTSSAQEQQPTLIIRWAGGLAAVAAIVVAGIWFTPSSDSDPTATAAAEFDQQDLQQMVSQLETFSEKWLVLAEPEAGPPVDNQLTEEWGALEADASAALEFLKQSFIPSRSSAS